MEAGNLDGVIIGGLLDTSAGDRYYIADILADLDADLWALTAVEVLEGQVAQRLA